MDWYPLWNSLRIALISCAAVFFLGIFAAYYIAKLPRTVKGVLDVVLTLPMVLPPTVVGYFLLLCSCGKKTKCSGQAVSVGKSAIEAADDYLDNNQSAHDALDRLDELKEKMEYVDSEDVSKPTHSADYSVSSDLVLLSHEITFDSIDHDRYDKILEKRNDIAKTIGEKKRK